MKKQVRHFTRGLALAVIAIFLCSAIPAMASHIPANGIELNRGTRGHDFDRGNDSTEMSGSNPFTGGSHSPMRPDRPNQFVVNHDNDQDVVDNDDNSNGNDDRGQQIPVPEGDGNPTLPNNNTPTAPVPEPTTFALMAPALIGLVRKLRK